MTHVVLLSAGQGKRLSPLTDRRPKCLVPIAGKPLLEWQLRAIEMCNTVSSPINRVTIVTGFQARSVEAAVKTMALSIDARCVYNPFYSVADNIGSCWSAVDILKGGCVLINGDTLFDPAILARLLEAQQKPVTVTIDQKDHYDDDDMKVRVEGDMLKRIGKKLENNIDGESVGMLRFSPEGGAAFAGEIEDVLQDPSALNLWYLSIIDRLADKECVGVLPVGKLGWQEVDFPHDVAAAAQCVAQIDWGGLENSRDFGRFNNEAGCS